MNQSATYVSVSCENCNNQFDVEQDCASYTCGTCGVTVDHSSATDDRHYHGAVTCTECQAINPGGLGYCAECGATLAASGAKPGSQAAARLRQEAAGELKSAYRGLTSVTLMYRLGAFAYAIATLLAVLALARTEIPTQPGLLVVALTTSLTVLLLMAALHLQFKPFLWTIAVAVLATGVSVVHFVGPNPFGVAFVGSAAWALLAWAALAPTFRFRKLIASHRDQYVMHHASVRTRRSLRGRTPHERHERLMRAMRRAARRTWRISATAAVAIIIASTLGSVAILKTARPEPLAPSRATFETAWNSGQYATVMELFDERVRATESIVLIGRIKGHGWHEVAPQLGEANSHQEEDGLWFDYKVNNLTISALWKRIGPSWSLLHIEVPLPPLAPLFEEFQQAWNASDVQNLVRFFAEGSRESMYERVQISMRERNWDSLPLTEDVRLQDDGTGTANGFLIFGKTSLLSEWYFSNEGVWRLHGLTFPKRYKARSPEPAKSE